MAKYRKKPIIVEAKLFEMGMEDGYACYPVFSNKLIGFYEKDEIMPKTNKKPAIKTLEGWYEVEVDKHYIIIGVKGERYPVEKEIFEETYEFVSE